MSQATNVGNYDEALCTILENEGSIIGFLSNIFQFLARRTDFYYVPQGPYENMGFPPGVAEELVIKVLRKCDPKCWAPNGSRKTENLNDEILCSTVAQEVEVVAEGEDDDEYHVTSDHDYLGSSSNEATSEIVPETSSNESTAAPTSYKPPEIPAQTNSEAYNGAVRDIYTWSQTIMDLDVTLKLPPSVKSSKDLKVTINPGDITVECRNGDVILKDALLYKIKTLDSFWSISEGKLLIHLEKVKERWWNKLLEREDAIDLDKIDCSRPLNELPEDHVDKVRELQWNQEQKIKGLPTSDEIRNIEILKKAWNAEGSPFKGKEFDPNIFKQ